MIIDKEKNLIEVEFNEMINIGDNPVDSYNSSYCESIAKLVNQGWEGVDDWTFGDYNYRENAIKGIKEGEPPQSGWTLFNELKDTMDVEVKRELKNFLKSRRKSKKEDGDELDIGALMSGDPAHWIKKHKKPKPAARIGVNIGRNCDVSSEQIKRDIIKLVIFCEKYELQGIPVEIIVYDDTVKAFEGEGRDTHFYTIIKLKRSEQRLDIGKILSCFCSPVLLRYYGFALQDYYSKITEKPVASGRGKAESSTELTNFYHFDEILTN